MQDEFIRLHKRLDQIESIIELKWKRFGGSKKVPTPKRIKKCYKTIANLRAENRKLHQLLAKQI